MEDISKLKTVELQNLLKLRGLPYYYRVKQDLVERLRNNIDDQEQGVSDSSDDTLETEDFVDAGSDDLGTVNSEENRVIRKEKSKDGLSETNSDKERNECLGKRNHNLEEKNTNKGISLKMTESNCFSFRDIEESLETFNGENGKSVTVWLKEFEQVSTMCKWTDIQNYLYARRLLRGAAKLAVETSEDCTGWDQLKTLLKKEFAVATAVLDIHKTLESRKKRNSESFLEYMYVMKQIASRGSFDEETIVAYIIQGIPDTPANKSILYEAKTIEALKNKLKAYEIMRSHQIGKPSSSHKSTEKQDKRNLQKDKKRCHLCGSFSHPTAECPHKSKGTRCFRCNEFGHIASNCSQPGKGRTDKSMKTDKDMKTFTVNVIPPPVISVSIHGRELKGMLDTGSDVTLMKESICLNFKGSIKNRRPGITLVGLGKKPQTSLYAVQIPLRMNEQMFDLLVQIVPDNWMNYDLLLGRDILKNVELRINTGGVVMVEKKACKEEDEKTNENFLTQMDVLSLTVKEKLPPIVHIADESLKNTIKDIISNYLPQKPEKSCVQMHIQLESEIPIFQKPRRIPPQERQIVNEQVQQWLKEGIIGPSSSDFASPVVLVKKADGSPRLCVDYRKLNAKIIKDRYPLPIIEEVLEGLYDSKVFTTLDLQNGFFHVDISEESRKYTAFITTEGHYEFMKAPFGLCNSPAVFQRFVNTVFQSLIREKVLLVYIDDLIIPSENEAENIEKLLTVLKVAEENGLIIKWTKCKFLERKVNFLGHIIENVSVRPSDEKVKAVMHFPVPKCIKDVKSFLGLCGYFRKFVRNYATLAKPLTELTKKDTNFHFGSEEIHAFNQLKQCLCNEPVLKLFNPELETELHTDASKIGLGAVLLQKHQDKKFHPVFYLSFKTNKHEQSYASYELECLAIVKSLIRLRYYLLGIKFKLFTDCNALQQTFKKKELSAKVARWVLTLEEYDCTVHHKSGNRMQHADALSRYPVVLAVEQGFLHQIRKAQSEDENCRVIIEILKNVPDFDNYIIKTGTLYRFIDGDFLLVVPKKLQRDLIKSVHEQGHVNSRKVQAVLKRDYYFQAMGKRIDKVLKSCVPCILAARKEGKPEGMLTAIEKTDVPLHTLHIDHLGPLASTAKNYKYLLVVIDSFTKFSWLFPVKNTSTDEVIKKLRLLSDIFGNPFRIISDRGTAFTSNGFKLYCEEQKINHVAITTGVPRGNGQVERLNRIIIAALSKMAIQDPTKWYKHVSTLQRFLNSMPSRATGKTPFELLIGTQMKKPEDIELVQLIEEAVIAEFESKRQEIRKEAKEAILKIQEENRKYNLRKRKKGPVYRIHDLVAIKQTQFQPNAKLFAKFIGPYEVIKIKKNDRYDLRRVGNHDGPKLTSSAVDNMKPWRDNVSDSSSESDA